MLILFNKPYQMLSQFNPNPDYPEQRTLPPALAELGVLPLGRLDYDSEGLLLLSDEPGLEREVLHPDRQHTRTYLVQVDGTPTEEAVDLLKRGGLEIRVGKKRHVCAPVQVQMLSGPPEWLWERSPMVDEASERRSSWMALTLTEGKNRQVRRMTAKIGCPTLRLIRAQVLEYEVEAIRSGEYVQTER